MAICEAWLLKQKVISRPFSAKEIAEGVLQNHLTQEDYDAPEGNFPFTVSLLQLVSS